MRVTSIPRVFVFLSILTLVLLVSFYFKYQNITHAYFNIALTKQVYRATTVSNESLPKTIEPDSVTTTTGKTENKTDFKYILQYTNPRNVPFTYMGEGQEGFTSRNCPFTNCIVTSNRNYLGDIKKFDVVAFCGPEVVRWTKERLPQERAEHQKYVYATIESSHYYPVCSNKLDGFFNWTWTFRLDSQVRWGYMDIRDANDTLIGPNKTMQWMKVDDMDPTSEELKEKLKSKTKAGAWFVSNCYDRSGRLTFAKELQTELKKFDLELDIFGKCGTKSCPRENHSDCMEMVDKSYYFYMSFENSFSEDYVTEKLLQALKIDVVPVVYGGANYTRFMPDGIYLNARELGAEGLAVKMNELIKDPEQYSQYFRWKKYYFYHSKHDRPETDEYCRMCELLNNEEMLKKTSVVENFRDWWDSPKQC